MENTSSQYEKDKLKERAALKSPRFTVPFGDVRGFAWLQPRTGLAKLSGGVAVIKAGSNCFLQSGPDTR